MPAFRPIGMRVGMIETAGIMPSDLLVLGESLASGPLTTVGAGTWTGALIATGIIRRTGPVGGYTDTTDTATNILAAIAGNIPNGANLMIGNSFRLLFVNTVAFAHTFAGGVGIVSGLGVLGALASTWREFNVVVNNAQPQVVLQSTTTNASALVTFVFPTGQVSYPQGNAFNAINITPGMSVSGTNITAGTTVLGVTQGVGGILGVTLSANATGTGAVSLTYSPTLTFEGLRSGTL